MTATIRFRPTHEDERIVRAAMREGEHTTDVIRRALRLLNREVWLAQARKDADRLKDENLSTEADAWCCAYESRRRCQAGDEINALVRMWHGLEVPDGLRVELLDGELVMQPNPEYLHDLPGRSLVRHTPEPFEAWSERGLLVADDYRPRADAVIIRSEDRPADEADADWPAQIVLAVVETVSSTRTAIKRDWEDKRERYAAVGIPVYLIADPNDATWHVLELEGRVYVETDKGVFGQPLTFPEPMGFTVQTHGWHPYSRTPTEPSRG